MKKLVPLVLGVVLGALAMCFYCNKINEQTPNEMTETPTPKGIVTPDEIKTLTEAYNPRYDTISETIFRGVPGGDNRSSWYSLEDLRNFLTLAEKQAQDLKYNMDGVRVYLGANPALKNRPGYTTLLFVPTGNPMTSEGNMLNLAPQGGPGPDIPKGNGLDHGTQGDPPSANYLQ
jgi:hypothetical protein